MKKSTSIEQSPFAYLGISTRDDRHKIVDLAEEKSLILDNNVCAKARSDLTNPRNRLTIEMQWLPGLSPRRASTLLGALSKDLDSIRDDDSIPALAHSNLIASAIELLDSEADEDVWSKWIVSLANITDSIKADEVLNQINEDRFISGFPEVRDISLVDAELEDRKRCYTEAIKFSLNKLPPLKLVSVVTDSVEKATLSGEKHAPQLIHELVDRYELEANKYLIPEAENIKKLIEAIRSAASLGEAETESLVNKLNQVVRKWDSVAQPIQLSAKAQGISHELSQELAWAIRSLAVDLFNDHNFLSVTVKLKDMLYEVFAELPDVIYKLDSDSEILDEIVKNREQSSQKSKEWEQEIYYKGEIGLINKDILEISSNGISWKGKNFPLEKVTAAKWGAIRHSVNGIPTGTDYSIGLSTSTDLMTISTRRGEVYNQFTDKLWKAVCVRLIEDTLNYLKKGGKVKYGTAEVDDFGILLTKHKVFGSNESIYKPWGEISYYSSGGYLVIQASDDKKIRSEISFMDVYNTHILEAVIRLSFKKWKGKLSGLLEA